LAAIALCNALPHLYLSQQAQQTTNLLLIMIGVACCYLSMTWTLLMVGVTWVAWWGILWAIAPSVASGEWVHFGFALLVSTIIAIMVQLVRLRTFTRLEKLRQSEQQHRSKLESALSETRFAYREKSLVTQQLEESLNAQRLAQDQQRRLVSLLEETTDFIYITDLRGDLLYSNQALRDRFLHRHPIHQVSQLYQDAGFARLQMEAIPMAISDGYWRGENEFWAPDGARVPVSQVLIAHRDEDGSIAYISSVARDITTIKQVERLKEEFIGTVSHELRTPLTALKGALGMLSSGAVRLDTAQAQDLLHLANRNSDRLSELVVDVMEISKIEAEADTFRSKPVPIYDLLQKVVTQKGQDAARQYVSLSIESPSCDCQTFADPSKIQLVMSKLIDNAIKYSPPGEQVRLRLERIEHLIRLEIEDRGPGVSPDLRAKLFEKFFRADMSDSRMQGGVGLGLSICKAIILKHGGQIGYEEAQPSGSVFYVELPLYIQSQILSRPQ